MTDLDPDDLEVFDDETDDNYARISKKDLESLRGAAKGASKSRKELETLQREKAISDAGLTDLTADQYEALAALVKEPTAEALKAKAVALGFIEAPPAPPAPTAEELAEHDAAAAVANGASAPASHLLKPSDVSGWDVQKRHRFVRAHPELAKALRRGETVTAPNGFAA